MAALAFSTVVSAGPHPPCPGKPKKCPARLDVSKDIDCIAKINGNKLEVKTVGNKNGPTIIVVPSTFGHSYYYLYKALEPVFDKYRFIFYDARGSGPHASKPKHPEKSMSTPAMASDIEGIQKLFGIKKGNLFSHCQGATAALVYAESKPENVANLFLAETILPDVIEDGSVEKYQDKIAQELAEAHPDIDYSVATNVFAELADPDSDIFPKNNAEAWAAFKKLSLLYFYNIENRPKYLAEMEAPDAPPFYQYALYWNTVADLTELGPVGPNLDKITANVHLLHGETDGASPKPFFDLLVKGLDLPKSNYNLVPKAAHMIWHDVPEIFYETVTGWFDAL